MGLYFNEHRLSRLRMSQPGPLDERNDQQIPEHIAYAVGGGIRRVVPRWDASWDSRRKLLTTVCTSESEPASPFCRLPGAVTFVSATPTYVTMDVLVDTRVVNA